MHRCLNLVTTNKSVQPALQLLQQMLLLEESPQVRGEGLFGWVEREGR